MLWLATFGRSTWLLQNASMSWDRIGLQFPGESGEELTSTVLLPGDFPMKEVHRLGALLEEARVFTAGYGPPSIGLCHPQGFLYEHLVEGRKTVLLPDRNMASRFSQIAKGARADDTLRTAAAVLAFCQCLEVLIEPGLAFHELAHRQGNEAANLELAWFRAADNGNVRDWIAYALGELDVMPSPHHPHEVKDHDLTYPLYRWRRNYAAALKIGSLELRSDLSSLQRMTSLLDWMEHEFIIAGPAALLASIYFAPNSPPRKRLFKQLKSPDRERAINGVQNAAWDISYLSELVRRVNDAEGGTTRYLMASFDKALGIAAASLIDYSAQGIRRESMTAGLCRWWPLPEATAIAQRLEHLFALVADSGDKPRRHRDPEYVSEAILHGEQIIRSYPAQSSQAILQPR